MFSRFDTIPACDGQTDRQTESLYLRRTSAWLTHVKIIIHLFIHSFIHCEYLTSIVPIRTIAASYLRRRCNWQRLMTTLWPAVDVMAARCVVVTRPGRCEQLMRVAMRVGEVKRGLVPRSVGRATIQCYLVRSSDQKCSQYSYVRTRWRVCTQQWQWHWSRARRDVM